MYKFRARAASFLLAGCGHILLVAPLSVALAQDSTSSTPDDPEARQCMTKMAAVYKAMKSYSGSVVVSGQLSGQPNKPSVKSMTKAVVSLQRPHLAAMYFTHGSDRNLAVYNGANLFATSSRRKNQYVKQPTSQGLGIMRVLTRAGMTGPGLGVLFNHPDMLEAFASPASLSLGKPTSVAGIPVVTVISKTQQGQNKMTLTYHIGKDDYLLRRMILVQTISGQMVTMTETHTNIKINPELPASTVTFKPPPGAKPVRVFIPPL